MRFDHRKDEHFHFVCDKCKKIFDVPSFDLEANLKPFSELNIKKVELTLRGGGICKECEQTNYWKGEKIMTENSKFWKATSQSNLESLGNQEIWGVFVWADSSLIQKRRLAEAGRKKQSLNK